jgi:diguanylate cyclase (GGDEF)-like protein/PAS domain S-box-containing protein
MKTKPPFNRNVQLAFGSAILVLLVVGAISYHGVIVSSAGERWVWHTHLVLEELQESLTSMQSIESSYRGFTLTGDEKYVESFHAGILLWQENEANLEYLTVDNPVQQRQFPTLDRLANEKIEFGEAVIALRRAKDMEAAANLIRDGEGQQAMDAFRVVIQAMQGEERQLLVQRNADTQRSAGRMRNGLILGVVLGLLVAGIAGWRVQRDSSKRELAEAALFAEKERAQVTLYSIGDAVVSADVSGNITFLNFVAEKMTGWSCQEAVGRAMSEVLQILDATSRETIPNPMEMAGRQDRTMHLPANSILIRRDGVEIPIEDSVSPIHDREGRKIGAVIVFHDVSAAQTMALQMTYSAQHDFLTGLPNRMLLNDRVSQAIALATRHMKKVSVLVLDLDGFKYINDSLGHPIGDKLLQSIAKCLVDCVRDSDTVSRQGGDEFIVLLSEVEESEDPAILARRVLQAVAESHSIDQHDLHVTASIGLSVYPDDGLDAETLIKHADTAMYQAKENGRQGYRFFTPAMNARAVERQSVEESLRTALQCQEFALHYQPKINLKTGAITGAEALIRWKHPTRGWVPPSEFIPVAEDCGLILPIGNWVLREACKQARAWIDAGLPLGTMAVNISAIQFRDGRFLDGVFAILKETGLDPRSLELELTEGVLMTRAEAAASVLKILKATGVQVAVDDFGTGYSSLSYLRKFPIDTLKIDQSFIHQITTIPDETVIVSAIIGIGRALNLRVVAEGVETPLELAFLQAHQCDEGQGYYFSRPIPPEQFAKLLETGISESVLR